METNQKKRESEKVSEKEAVKWEKEEDEGKNKTSHVLVETVKFAHRKQRDL